MARCSQHAFGRRISAAADALPDTMPLPSVMLWAWERPDDLRSVAPSDAGVAYLAGTLFIREEADADAANSAAVSVAYRPRLQTLQTAHNIKLLPVVRIETVQAPGGDADRALASDQIQRAVDILARAATSTTPPSIQIDFDATESERDSYLALLAALRTRLGANARISITALASWCDGDGGSPIYRQERSMRLCRCYSAWVQTRRTSAIRFPAVAISQCLRAARA